MENDIFSIITIIDVVATIILTISVIILTTRIHKNETKGSITSKTISCLTSLYDEYKKTMGNINEALEQAEKIKIFLQEYKESNFSDFNEFYYSDKNKKFRNVHYFFELLGTLIKQSLVERETFWDYFTFPLDYFRKTKDVRILIWEKKCLPTYAENFCWLFEYYYDYNVQNNGGMWVSNGEKFSIEINEVKELTGPFYNKFKKKHILTFFTDKIKYNRLKKKYNIKKLSNNDLNWANNIFITSNTITLCELEDSDCTTILNIVKAYSLEATAVLFNELYLQNKEISEEEIKRQDKKLLKTFRLFDIIQLRNSFEPYSSKNLIKKDENRERRKHINRLINEIKNTLGCNNTQGLFSPYGPLQAMTISSVKKFINKAKNTRNSKKRKTFRLGIKYKDILIGCFTFDFIYKKIKHDNNDYYTIGDFGIFINPEYREIKDKNGNITNRCWRDTFFVFSVLIKKIFFHYIKNENTYISATTHPFNTETQRMFSTDNKFIYLKNRINSKYGNRKHFIIKYEDFLDVFLEKRCEEEYNEQKTWVKVNSVLLYPTL